MKADAEISPLAQKLHRHLPGKGKRWWLAVSGGMDSMCLMALVKELHQSDQYSLPPISVVHINHGLQPESSQWQKHVEQAAKQAGFDFVVIRVKVDAGLTADQGLEAAARTARYHAFAGQVQKDECLLLGHHSDDQAETFLLRLLRGAGIAGLGAMPSHRLLQAAVDSGELWRPMLTIPHDELLSYAQQYGLTWVDDPSNQDCQQDRNYLRHELMPLLKQRWPAWLQRIQVTSQLAQQSQVLLDDLASLDFQTTQYGQQDLLDKGLAIDQLAKLSQLRRANLLRWWLRQVTDCIPSQQQLMQIDQQFIKGSATAMPHILLGQGYLYRHGNCFNWQVQQDPLTPWLPEKIVWPPAELACAIKNAEQGFSDTGLLENTLMLALAGGCLIPKSGGLNIQAGDVLEVRQRQGGERCRPQGRQHSQTLKKLLQEYQVPTTQRAHLPLFYVNGELAMVGQLWVCYGYTAPTKQMGWQWQPLSEKVHGRLSRK